MHKFQYELFVSNPLQQSVGEDFKRSPVGKVLVNKILGKYALERKDPHVKMGRHPGKTWFASNSDPVCPEYKSHFLKSEHRKSFCVTVRKLSTKFLTHLYCANLTL